MAEASSTVGPAPVSRFRALRLLTRDVPAFIAAVFLVIVVITGIIGAPLLSETAGRLNLPARSLPPFSLDRGWLYLLGADSLGRSILARVIVATQSTLAIAVIAVSVGLVVGILLGLWAGYRGGWVSTIIMRVNDALMSFPTMLLAILLLYILQARVGTVVVVLAITRIPLFLRVTRAEVMEVRERMFVTASRSIGATSPWIIFKHVLPTITPTLLTVAALELAFVMLSESSLSFIGVGVQTPNISWGLLVSQGRNYLTTAWWIAFWPGLAIVLTAISLNLVASWARAVFNPLQSWRLETRSNA
jgi:peptide/nickel transport system permease protein